MQNDIVGRLRAVNFGMFGGALTLMCVDAANEIERLRADVRAAREQCARVAEEIAEGHEFDAPFQGTEEEQHAKLMYAKHIRRVAAAIRAMP